MAYTAIRKMNLINKERFHCDYGPKQPKLYVNSRKRNDLKSAVLRFLHNRCEELRFDAAIEQEEREKGVYLGTALNPGQIPYNMQMDINRLCLEKSLETFCDSGVAEDAYSVYYCFLEIFVGRYGRSKKMIELLSEYEQNGSSLLMKHRDHYSHSVYVFALGLAIYETNENYRRSFREFYHLESAKESEAANNFLEFWGLSSLFHDIGYPFELPFEQVLSYFEVNNQRRGKESPFLAYHNMETLTALDGRAREHFSKLYGKTFATSVELIAHNVTLALGEAFDFTEEYLLQVLNQKPTEPDRFGYYMDHAFFSAVRLYNELAAILGPEALTRQHVDALSAIILHNSLYKFAVAFYKDKDPSKRKGPLQAPQSPLAWLLMLCDELQCWNRTAYGRNSRTELHPMDAGFDFSNNAIEAVYDYDIAESDKIAAFLLAHEAWEKAPEQSEEPRLKAYSDMAGTKQRFTEDIRKIVDTSGCPLTVKTHLCRPDFKSKRVYLSGSNFLHMYDFAVALHSRSMPPDATAEEMERKFTSHSLEYQLSTLNRARNFARYLDAIQCFYTDKPVAYEQVLRFGKKDAERFAPMEHERWLREHQAMGWCYGREYETLPLDVPAEEMKKARSALREQLRRHKLMLDGELTPERAMLHYHHLSESDQQKDWKPFNKLLVLLKKFDGVRIYRL